MTILRSDNGETWREHSLEATEDAIQEALGGSFEGEGDWARCSRMLWWERAVLFSTLLSISLSPS